MGLAAERIFYSEAFRHERERERERMATVGGIKQKEGSENSLTVDELAQFAVNEHNNKANALLEFHRVVNTKEQVVSGTMYYITLEAKDGDKVKVYEAKVWVKPWMNFKEVQEFKYVGDAPADASSS